MNLTPAQKKIIERVVNVFETGKLEGDYAAIAIFPDGPGNVRQITYGRSQTTESSKLRQLVQRYVQLAGRYSAALAPYVEQVGTRPLVDDATFKDLLRRAGQEDPLMRQAQDEFFDEQYFRPALKWMDENQLVLPLSALVIYDSFIHSGGIRWDIREMFKQAVPVDGGEEKAWVSAYVRARHRWLGTHPRTILRKTTYRTQCLLREIERSNWQLSKLPISTNQVLITAG